MLFTELFPTLQVPIRSTHAHLPWMRPRAAILLVLLWLLMTIEQYKVEKQSSKDRARNDSAKETQSACVQISQS